MAYDRDVFSYDVCWYCFWGKSFGYSSREVMEEMESFGFSVWVKENKRAFFVYRRVYCVDKRLMGWAYHLVEEETEASLFFVVSFRGVHLGSVRCVGWVSCIGVLGRVEVCV